MNSLRINFSATKATLLGGNVVKIDDVFGGRDLPFKKEILFELKFNSLKNPFSVRPAGPITIATFRGGYKVDEGTSAETYTPTPGLVDGRQIFVSDAMTNAISSTYKLIFVPESIIPANGLIQIDFPPELKIFSDEMLLGGDCIASGVFICKEAKDDEISLTLMSVNKVKAGESLTFNLVGFKNPRTDAITGPVIITTKEQTPDGAFSIDTGFRVGTSMETLWPIDDF